MLEIEAKYNLVPVLKIFVTIFNTYSVQNRRRNSKINDGNKDYALRRVRKSNNSGYNASNSDDDTDTTSQKSYTKNETMQNQPVRCSYEWRPDQYNMKPSTSLKSGSEQQRQRRVSISRKALNHSTIQRHKPQRKGRCFP